MNGWLSKFTLMIKFICTIKETEFGISAFVMKINKNVTFKNQGKKFLNALTFDKFEMGKLV